MGSHGYVSVMKDASRLPSLGPRGEGWAALQLVLYGLVAAGGLWGGEWSRGARTPLRVAALVLGGVGLLMLILAAGRLGRALTPYPRPRESSNLASTGIYSLVRHPIYGGVLALSIAWSLWTSPIAMLATSLVAVFLELKSRREEVWLLRRYPEYSEYRRRVKRRFLPAVW